MHPHYPRLGMIASGILKLGLFAIAFGLVAVGAEAPAAGVLGHWYSEHVDSEKGMIHQALGHMMLDGSFVAHFRARRHDIPDRLLDYTIGGEWKLTAGKYIQRVKRFEIREKDVSPQSGLLDAEEEYEVLELTVDRFVTKAKNGSVFRSRRVDANFQLPDLPLPPAATKPREPDKTKFDAYVR